MATTWTINWRGKTYEESDLKGKHLAVLALINGRDDFNQLEIQPGNGHQRLMQLITAFAVIDAAASASIDDPEQLALQVAQSLNEVSEATVDEIFGALTYTDD